MAGFETTHGNPVSEAVREWRFGRFAPLYAAGIIGGAALGLGIATWPGGDADLREHVAIAPLQAPGVVDDAPSFILPSTAPILGAEAINVFEPWMEVADDRAAALIDPASAVPAIVATSTEIEAPAPIVAAAPIPAVPAAPAAPAPVAPAPVVQQAPPPPAPVPVVETKPNFYVPAVSGGAATGMELQLLQLINAERANAGLGPYSLESGLTKIARTRSQQLIDQNYFGHRDPYGYSMYVELLAHFGYTSYAWAGENLAMNNWPSDTAANEAIRGLMNSPTHRANILAGDFSRIGVGEVTSGDGRHFFTMIFLS